MTQPRLTAVAAFVVLLAPQAALAGGAPQRDAQQIWRERQHLPAAGPRKATARTGDAEPAAAHEGKRRHRTAIELVRARQQLPVTID